MPVVNMFSGAARAENHCYLYVLFISQPQSTNFEQNLTRSLHFIGLTSEVGGAS